MRRYPLAILGNILKYYDQALYGFLTPFLAPLFFPHEDPIYSLLSAYALIPLGFLAVPVGAYVFGRLADRRGRKFCLSLTLLGLGCTTALLGFLPTFAEAGWLGPILLGGIRLLQNFFAAGEVTAGALFLLEPTPPRQRGFMSSLFDASTVLGIFLAGLAVSVVGQTHWRWLFWFGGLSGLIGCIIRFRTTEKFSPPRTQKPWTSSDWTALICVSSVSGFSYANYYLLSTFLNGFLPLICGMTLQEAIALNTVLLAVDLLLVPCFGWLSFHVAKEKLLFTATLLTACLACPLFFLLDGAGTWLIALVRLAFTAMTVCLTAPYHAWAMEAAPPEKRALVCSMGSALGGRLIGAPIPAIALWLYHKTGWVASSALPLVFSALLAGGAILYLQKQKSCDKSPQSL